MTAWEGTGFITLTELQTKLDACGYHDSPRPRFNASGRLLCSTCGQVAHTIHLVPWVTDVQRIEAACPSHDPGGYWFHIKDFGSFVVHIAESKGGYTCNCGDPQHAAATLLEHYAYTPLTKGWATR